MNIHPTHRLKAYTGDVNKRHLFCERCGKEEDEEGIKEPCPGKFYASGVDNTKERK